MVLLSTWAQGMGQIGGGAAQGGFPFTVGSVIDSRV